MSSILDRSLGTSRHIARYFPHCLQPIYRSSGSRFVTDGSEVRLIGPEMPSAVWAHVAFTGSVKSQAQLYTSGFLKATSSDGGRLNDARGGHNSAPMIVILGEYDSTGLCAIITELESSQKLMGSLDELFVFSRELLEADLQETIQS